jgi:NAD(P)H dehydrogenase (quinone)
MSLQSTQEHLVLGASGAQGSAIVRELLARGHRVTGLVRSSTSEVASDAKRVFADLGDADSLAAAFDGITHLTVTLPLVYDQATVDGYARNIATAAAAAGVQRIVFNANTRTPSGASGVAAFDTRASAEKILRASSVPVVLVQPAVYLENLLAPASVAGMKQYGQLHYPLPAAMPVAWIALSDLAIAVAEAHALAHVPDAPILVGGKPVTGDELALQLSGAIGRPLSYVPLDPAAFENMLAGFLGNDAAAGVAGLYHWAKANPESPLFGAGVPGSQDGSGALLVSAMAPQEWSQRQPWAQ